MDDPIPPPVEVSYPPRIVFTEEGDDFIDGFYSQKEPLKLAKPPEPKITMLERDAWDPPNVDDADCIKGEPEPVNKIKKSQMPELQEANPTPQNEVGPPA